MRLSRPGLSISLAVALSLPVIGSASAATLDSTTNGSLIVSAGQTTVAINPAGGSVTGTVANGQQAVYSSDGKRIAYLYDNGPCVQQPEGGCVWQPDLMTSNADGTNQQLLVHAIQGEGDATDDYVIHPDWSPNGKQIIFDSPHGLGMVNTDGTGLQTLTDGGDGKFSPAGGEIAFIRDTSYVAADGSTQYGPDVYVMDLATRAVVQVTTDHQAWSTPLTWSPDGTRIVYATQNGLNAIDVATGQVTNLVDPTTWPTGLTDVQTPVFSPDGSQIAFSGYDPNAGVQGIYAVNADGSNFRTVAATGGTLTEWTE
ncbi:TolB family protein [Streptomyces sp. NPDC088560]|uniref:TolB family protein n=1 Tax=Streptomyces sp. NPDC088560 TaxID=3365868 RepID=UPI003828D23D